ncbi:MAG: caspase family protein [Cyanobacteria bacterium P01_D01_bin.105]
MGNVYALLVGIDQYDERLNVPPLKGCVNDIQRIQGYLKSRISPEVEVHIRALTNEQATRQGVIEGFRQHLSQAQEADTALFYYAGYGARCILPQQALETRIAPLTETLVCYDSRINAAPEKPDNNQAAEKQAPEQTHWDLSAPELTHLLSEVSHTQAHVVAILDARQTAPDLRSRPLSSLISSQPYTANQSRTGRYVLLKASNLTEQAQEYFSSLQPMGTQPSGAFSYFLYKSLAAANSQPTYQDLFQQTNALVRSSMPTQSPQLIATHPEDLSLPFLGEAGTTSPHTFIVRHDATKGWIVNGGAVHGLPASAGNETTKLALFPQAATPQQMAHMGNAIATAHIERAHPRFSAVKSAQLTNKNKEETFKALITDLAIPTFHVHIEGDAAAVSALQKAIATAGPNDEPSLYVQPTDLPEQASFHVLAQDGSYTLTTQAISATTLDASELEVASANRAPLIQAALNQAALNQAAMSRAILSKARPLVAPILGGYDAVSAARMSAALEHIARWKTIVELASPALPSIQDAVKIKLYSGDEAEKEDATQFTADQIRLMYQDGPPHKPQAQTPPRFRIKLHNTSHRPLYCGLFYLTERFKAAAIKPNEVNHIVQLAPGEEMWFADGRPLYGTVPDELWQQGITECQDMIKLVACTQPFDPTLMNLGPLGSPIGASTPTVNIEDETVAHCFNQLMQRIIHREIPAQTTDQTSVQTNLATAHWTTCQFAFTSVRPSLPVPLTSYAPASIGADAASAPNVIVHAHPQFTAIARLTTQAQAARTFGLAAVTSLLQTDPFCFSVSRNSASGLSVLHLTQLTNVETVTAQQPLRIATDIVLEKDEYILPVAYDGETYLPLGYGKTNQGKTQIFIERLPDPFQPAQSRKKGICITFQKVKATHLAARLSQRYGQPVAYPLLSAAHTEPFGEVRYTHNAEAIAFKVEQAQKIALYLPGPFNDTEADLPYLNQALIAANAAVEAAAETPYDLLLTFDYDALETAFEQNAECLAQCLANVGLSANHTKQLHVIAHSTSGLIARWFIEQAGGNAVIDHLLMLGTPNGGISPDQLQTGATAAIALSLNGLSHLPTPINTIGNLFRCIRDTQQNLTIEQAQPQSDCLQTLLSAVDPGTPYTILTGQLSSYEVFESRSARPEQVILCKLTDRDSTTFQSQIVEARANDLIVSVSSMRALPGTWDTPAKKRPIICHHLDYLTHPEGIFALSQALIQAGKQVPKAIPEPAPELAPELPPEQAVPEPEPELAPELAPELTLELPPESAPEQAIPEPAPELAIPELAPEPAITELAPEPAVPELAPEPVIAELAPEPAIPKLAPEPAIAELAPEPAIPELAPEPAVPELAPELVSESAPEPAPQPIHTKVAKPLAIVNKAAIASTSAGIAIANRAMSLFRQQPLSHTSDSEASSSMNEPPQPPESTPPEPTLSEPTPPEPTPPESSALESQAPESSPQPEPEAPALDTPEPPQPEPEVLEPQALEPQASETQVSESQISEPQSLEPQLTDPQLTEQKPSGNEDLAIDALETLRQPDQTPSGQASSIQSPAVSLEDNEPAAVYAPNYAPSPESKSSPLSWIWMLLIAVLAGLVTLGWIQYFNSPATPSEQETNELEPKSPELEIPRIPTGDEPT